MSDKQKIVPFKVVSNDCETVPDIVEALEKLLAAAKAGRLQQLAYATVHKDGSFNTWWHGERTGDMDFALGMGIVRLAWRFQNEAFSEISSGHDDEK